MNKDWIYVGAFLDDKTRELILNKYKDFIPEGWKLYADHTTFAFNNASPLAKVIYEHYKASVGAEVELISVGLGKSDRAVALELSKDGFETVNRVMHITLAVAPDAKPVESNNITDWEPIGSNNDVIQARIGVFANGQVNFEKQ